MKSNLTPNKNGGGKVTPSLGVFLFLKILEGDFLGTKLCPFHHHGSQGIQNSPDENHPKIGASFSPSFLGAGFPVP